MVESFFWRKALLKSGLARFLPSVKTTLNGGEDHLHRYSDRLLATPLARLLDPNLMPTIETPDSFALSKGVPGSVVKAPWPRSSMEENRDAWGDLELRRELAMACHLDSGTEYDAEDEVLITHGGSASFASAIDAFINPGDRVVTFDPTTPLFAIGFQHRRAKVVSIPTSIDDEGHLRFEIAKFSKALRGAKMLAMCDPCNPTGGTFSAEDLQQIAYWAFKHDVLIYRDASFDHWRHQRPRTRLATLPYTEGRLLTACSFSKSHGLSTTRVGWLMGNRHLVRPCATMAALNAPFVPMLNQGIALSAMKIGKTSLESERQAMESKFVYTHKRLTSMGLKSKLGQAGFCHWVETPNGESGHDFAQRLLAETGVLVHPGSPFGNSGSQRFRLSVAIEEGRLREALDRLERLLTGKPQRPSKAPSALELAPSS
jgi:aspartate/methionine/tyrosine aminotransferase